MITLNKKEYPYSFTPKYIEEYCNLEIYSELNVLETEAGLLSDFAEAFELEGKPASFVIYGNSEGSEFLKDNLQNFHKNKVHKVV